MNFLSSLEVLPFRERDRGKGGEREREESCLLQSNLLTRRCNLDKKVCFTNFLLNESFEIFLFVFLRTQYYYVTIPRHA